MGQLADMPPQVLLAIIVAAEPAYEDVLDALFTFHDRAPADVEPFQLANEAWERLVAFVRLQLTSKGFLVAFKQYQPVLKVLPGGDPANEAAGRAFLLCASSTHPPARSVPSTGVSVSLVLSLSHSTDTACGCLIFAQVPRCTRA